jgi:phosphatidylserine/phosphatidylglycerophosphate/cardiolipin synthase-like enzyme
MRSGPDIAGTPRDTGVVLRELFSEAEHRVLVVGFAVHQGREIFAALAGRMRHRADLAVRLCLDVRRAPGDTTRWDALLRPFAERFVRQEWPGPRLPDVYYDPRSLAESESYRASLHAKCVVVDGLRGLIGSANLTEAAQLRNIEIIDHLGILQPRVPHAPPRSHEMSQGVHSTLTPPPPQSSEGGVRRKAHGDDGSADGGLCFCRSAPA